MAPSKRANLAKVVRLKSARPDKQVLELVRQISKDAEAGGVHGIAVVIDHGAGDFSYSGHGSLVRNKLIGHAVVLRLAKKFL